MTSVWRALLIYGVLLLIFRVSGKRTLSQISSLDLILLLIIGEATQQALLGDDFSITNAIIVIVSLVGIDLVLGWLTNRVPMLGRVIDGSPLIVVDSGTPMKDRMRRSRVTEADILEAARQTQGLERMDQIKYAVIEKSGDVSIIPWSQGEEPGL
ncbi:MAG: DUF421 domain-containing protein [Acidimicrobiia bacterium]|nr:DUF421 domain-containing protein [Acidimicrobiia bacterium]